MKQLLVLIMLTVAIPVFSQSNKIRDKAAKEAVVELEEGTSALEVQVAELESVVANIPDSFLMVIGQDSFYFPIKDGRIIVDTVKEIRDENKGSWPTSPLGWLNLVILIALGGKATQIFTSGKNIYKFLKPIFQHTLGIVAFAATAISTGLTFVVGNGVFDYTMFLGISGWMGFIAIFVYERWIKPKES